MGRNQEDPKRIKRRSGRPMEAPRNPKAVKGHRKLQRLQKVLRRRRKLKRVLRRKKKRTRRKKPRRVVKISSDLALAMSRCWPRDSNRTLILGRVGEHPNFWGNLREPKFGQVIGQENARFWSSRQSRPLSRQLLIAVKAVFSC